MAPVGCGILGRALYLGVQDLVLHPGPVELRRGYSHGEVQDKNKTIIKSKDVSMTPLRNLRKF